MCCRCGVDTSGFANGVDPTPARQAFLKDHPANRPVLLFLSRIHQKKGLNELIEAVGLLGDAGKPATLVVAGQDDGEYARQAKQLAKQLGLDGGPRGDVRFVASVGGTLKWSLYAAADLFTLATRQENFGLVLIEAMGCGTPIVTTKGTDIWPVLEANGGHIVGMSPQAFAEGIMNALADADDLRRRATQGRQYVLEHLDAPPDHEAVPDAVPADRQLLTSWARRLRSLQPPTPSSRTGGVSSRSSASGAAQQLLSAICPASPGDSRRQTGPPSPRHQPATA